MKLAVIAEAIKIRPKGSGGKCPLCLGPIEGKSRKCKGCGSAMHPECWSELGGCPTRGCKDNISSKKEFERYMTSCLECLENLGDPHKKDCPKRGFFHRRVDLHDCPDYKKGSERLIIARASGRFKLD